MREFSTSLREALFNGLKPGGGAAGLQYLNDCYNLVAYPTYFGSYKPVTDLLNLADDYPFPQWLRLKDFNVVVRRDNVQQKPGVDITEFSKGTYTAQDFTEPFYGVSYGDRFMLLNRDACVYFDGTNLQKDLTLRASAIVKHKNRTIIGGALDGLWTPAWKTFLEAYASAEITSSFNIKKNSIFWSSFDSSDFPFALVDPDLVLAGAGDFVDMLRHNEWGFLELSFHGDVLDIVEFQDNLVVAGEDGISFVSFNPDLPGSGYGEVQRLHTGIKSRGCIVSDNNQLVFIDNESHLWHLVTDPRSRQQRQVFDFSEYLSELGENVYMRKDPHEDLFYVGDGERSFVYNGRALFRVFQTVGAIDPGLATKQGVVFETGLQNALIESDTHDLFNHAQKTLVGVGVIATKPVAGVIQAQAEVKGSYFTSPPYKMNHEAYTATRIFGREHIIKIDFTTFEDKNIRAIELKWQADDVRYRRGVSGLEGAGTAGS